MLVPNSCSHRAYQFFERQIAEIDSTHGLVNASMAIAMHAFEDLDSGQVWQQLDQLVQKIKFRLRGNNPEAFIAHIHDVLFRDELFMALPKKQNLNLLDSFLPTVLELKVGTPEVVGLVYKVVAESVGIIAEPVHLLDRMAIRVYDGHGWLLVDLVNRGRLHKPEGLELVKLPILSNREWILRKLARIMSVLKTAGKLQDYAAMLELVYLMEGIEGDPVGGNQS